MGRTTDYIPDPQYENTGICFHCKAAITSDPEFQELHMITMHGLKTSKFIIPMGCGAESTGEKRMAVIPDRGGAIMTEEITERCKGCEWYRPAVEQIGYNSKKAKLKPFCIELRLHIEWVVRVIEDYGRCHKYYPKQHPSTLKKPNRESNNSEVL